MSFRKQRLIVLGLICMTSLSYANSKIDFLNHIKQQMIFIKGGNYTMGAPNKNWIDITGNNVPAHKVELTSFSMQKTLVTNQQYAQYVALRGIPLTAELKQNLDLKYRSKRPTKMTWKQSLQFCQWVGKQLNISMSLPSEAQWEYAARNRGENCPFPTNNCKIEFGKNYPPTIQWINSLEFHNIMKYPPNKLGFYDMIGSGVQWMLDSYTYGFYQHSPIKNPVNLRKKHNKAVRGSSANTQGNKDGTVNHFNMVSFSSYNRSDTPADLNIIAFRCVVNSDKPLN